MPQKSYSPSDVGNINSAYSTSDPNIPDSSTAMPNERTVLSHSQTYFAEERIQIPETSHVCSNLINTTPIS